MTKVTHMQAKRFTIRKQRMTVLGNLMTLQKSDKFSFAADTKPGSSGLQSTQKYHSGRRQLVNPQTRSARVWATTHRPADKCVSSLAQARPKENVHS